MAVLAWDADGLQVAGDRPPAFIHVRVLDDGEGYVPAMRVTTEPAVREFALREALAMLEGLRKRYASIDALAPVWEAVAAVAGQGTPARPRH